MAQVDIQVGEDDSTLLLPQVGLAYWVEGSASRVARNLRWELRLRRWGYSGVITVCIVGWAVAFTMGSTAFLIFGLLGASMVILRLVDPSMFGNLDRRPYNVVCMDALRPRSGLTMLESYPHSNETSLDRSTT